MVSGNTNRAASKRARSATAVREFSSRYQVQLQLPPPKYLVPSAQSKAKVLLQIVHDATHKTTAIQEQWCVEVGAVWAVVPPRIRLQQQVREEESRSNGRPSTTRATVAGNDSIIATVSPDTIISNTSYPCWETSEGLDQGGSNRPWGREERQRD